MKKKLFECLKHEHLRRDSKSWLQEGRQHFKSPKTLTGFQYRVESSELAPAEGRNGNLSKVSEFGSPLVKQQRHAAGVLGMRLQSWMENVVGFLNSMPRSVSYSAGNRKLQRKLLQSASDSTSNCLSRAHR